MGAWLAIAAGWTVSRRPYGAASVFRSQPRTAFAQANLSWATSHGPYGAGVAAGRR